jgi:hypothetical protein
MVHDAVTFNGMYSGILGASLQGMSLDATAADYLALTNACLACATQFDTALNTAGTVGANAQRGFLAQSIGIGTFTGRSILNLGATGIPGSAPVNPATAANYTAVAAAMVAQYTEAVGNLA